MANSIFYNFFSIRRWLLTSLAIVFLQGCSPSPSDTNREYQHRLAKVLELDTIDVKPITIPPLQRPQLPEPVKISLLELGRLNQCRLSQLIANHNNQLGKTAYPSELLKYQIRFVKQLNECTNELDDSENELKTRLNESFQQKLTTLPLYFDNIIAGEAEFQRLLRISTAEFVDNNNSDTQKSFEALSFFVLLKHKITQQQFYDIDEQQITSNLALLNNTGITAILSSASRQITFNQSTSRILNSLDVNKLCRNPDKAHIAGNIFQKFYIKQIQPYQATITANLELLSPKLNTLLEKQPNIRPLFTATDPNSLISALKASAKEHVGWWQQFYKQCKINPYQ